MYRPTGNTRIPALIAAAALLLSATVAQAQRYNSYSARQPSYHDGARPYAIEVAPNTYVIRRPAGSRRDPQLRRRGKIQRKAITTRNIARDKPVVVEHRRMVDDSRRVIERQHVVEDAPSSRGLYQHRRAVEAASPRPPRAPAAAARRHKSKRAHGAGDERRVIHADAEITILGPDRMNIRLFRKGGDANARAR